MGFEHVGRDINHLGGGNSNDIFFENFHADFLGMMIQFDSYVFFLVGWFNHQLE